MMRLEPDSRGAGLLNASTKYSSLETTRHDVSEFRECKRRRYVVLVSAGVVFIAVVVMVSVAVGVGKKTETASAKSRGIRNQPRGFAPPPGPRGHSGSGTVNDWGSLSPSAAVAATDPVGFPPLSPLSSLIPIGPAPLAVMDASSSSPSLPYATICNKTINRVDCLNMFRSNPNSQEGDLKQWTVMAMEAAEHALNESNILAKGMKKENEGNVALQQCIEVFADALENVDTSISLVAGMNIHNPGKTGNDVQTYMSAAITNQDTCEEGIDDVGSFPGSDKITGQQAKHVDTMLSIALTFVNHLSTPTMDRYRHRRLLHIKSTGSGRRASFSGVLTMIRQVLSR